jgi:hypothetical protein
VGHFFNSMQLCRRSARLHESAAGVPRKSRRPLKVVA